MGLFCKFRKKQFFPPDKCARREIILQVHRQISGNDDLLKPGVIDTLLDLIDGEKDVFQIDTSVIYYIGYYKPFGDGNEETAKFLADGILADKGIRIPDQRHSVDLLYQAFEGTFTIDALVEWQKEHYEKI